MPFYYHNYNDYYYVVGKYEIGCTFQWDKSKIKMPNRTADVRDAIETHRVKVVHISYTVFAPKGKRFTSENVGYTWAKLFYYTRASGGAAPTPPP